MLAILRVEICWHRPENEFAFSLVKLRVLPREHWGHLELLSWRNHTKAHHSRALNQYRITALSGMTSIRNQFRRTETPRFTTTACWSEAD